MFEAVASTWPANISVRRLSGSLGAEVIGPQLAELSDTEFADIYQLFVEHQVLVFRKQSFTPEQYLAFAQRWGEIHQHPFMQHLDDYPGILEIIKTETDVKAFGNDWHSDQMFTETPAKCTMLYAREVPEFGGDTLFANMYDAYDGLSDGMKELLVGLRGWNTGDREKLRAKKSGAQRTVVAPSQMQVKAPPSGALMSGFPTRRSTSPRDSAASRRACSASSQPAEPRKAKHSARSKRSGSAAKVSSPAIPSWRAIGPSEATCRLPTTSGSAASSASRLDTT